MDLIASTGNIDELTVYNRDFRRVIDNGKYLQLVLMSLKPGEDIGLEVHEDTDQFVRVEEGYGEAVLGDCEFIIKTDDYLFIPAGTYHNVINTDEEDMKLYVIYSDIHHSENCVQRKKSDPEC